MSRCVLATCFGNIEVDYTENEVCGIGFVSSEADSGVADSPLVFRLLQQIDAYCHQANFEFDLPLKLTGTDFQQRVWAELCRIPAGQVRTYGEIAGILSSSARAVGNACRANPVALVVPCHRVVAKNGAGGYMGQMDGENLDIKRRLLRHEGLEI